MGEPAERAAAVLVPFYRDAAGELRVVLIERAPGGRHGGQIALPGGNREPADESLRDTAIRETGEELGIEPGQIEVLGVRPPMRTRSNQALRRVNSKAVSQALCTSGSARPSATTAT